MSKAERLFNRWINDPKVGKFWENHIVVSHSKEDIEEMTTIQLKALKIKINNWKQALKDTKGKFVDPDYTNGYDYVKKILEELKVQYWYYILNTNIDFKDSNKTIENVPSHFTYDRGEQTTFFKIYAAAEVMVLKAFHKQCLVNMKDLIMTCDAINLPEYLKSREQEQEVLNKLSPAERNKHYEVIRRAKSPSKEKERRENSILRLKEWKEENPEAYKQSQKKYKQKLKDLTICETTEDLAAKVVKIAIAKALESIANAERYKRRKELKELK
jgi:hypothetical protein